MRVVIGPFVPLVNLLAAMLLGLFLRFIPLQNSLNVNYKFFLHAHSHVAFLGWVYMSLFILILHTIFKSEQINLKSYRIQFWFSQITVIGMLIFFPIQGYAFFSIVFSTLHIFVSYWFCYTVIKDINRSEYCKTNFPVSIKFIQASLFFLIISSLGPFFLGFVMAKGLSGHPIYNLSIYYYLHFQYNGWFSFACIGILVAILESGGWVKSSTLLNKAFLLLFIACIPSYFLSTLYLKPSLIFYFISMISAVLQIIAAVLFFKSIKLKELLIKVDATFKFLLKISLISFIIKIVLQFFSVVMPIFQVRNFIIGYLHLTLIGFISFAILAVYVYYKFIHINRSLKLALYILFAGFFFSELILFSQGLLSTMNIAFPYYFTTLFGFSILMLVGLVLILFSQSFKKRFN